MAWSDDRIQLLKNLWGDGLSAEQIAVELGGITRNAVIGKIHRLGLSKSTRKPKAAAAPRERRTPKLKPPPAYVATEAPVAEEEPIPEGGPVPKMLTVLELDDDTCKFPIGDPRWTTGFGFCGCGTLIGFRYCLYHCRVAYNPAGDRRAR